MKAAFISKPAGKSLTDKEKNEWKHVRILIIDEISFMSDGELQKLDRRLKEMRDRTKPFGGFSIIFAGDFCQLQPSNVSDDMLLYSKQSSCLFEHYLNCIIILDNDHQFKDNPKLGKMLK